MAATPVLKTTFLQTGAAASVIKDLSSEADEIHIAVAWADDEGVFEALMANKRRIRHIVIGTHFASTKPEVFRQLANHRAARYWPPDGPTFHPKIYAFEKGRQASVIIGSANLTYAGMNANFEAGVLLEGSKAHPAIEGVLAFIRDHWKIAKKIDPDFLADYQKARNRMKAWRKKQPKPKASGIGGAPKALDMDWPSFLQSIRDEAAIENELPTRLGVLDAARSYWKKQTFAEMTFEQRRHLMGLVGDRQIEELGVAWSWFGSPRASRNLPALLEDEKRLLSRAIDAIPLSGVVTEKHYADFLGRFSKVFKNGRGVGTRLLAMRRPDYFVAINEGNIGRLAEALGTRPGSIKMSTYWELIVQPMQLSAWWNSTRPNDLQERRIWQGRTALLDVVYYDRDA